MCCRSFSSLLVVTSLASCSATGASDAQPDGWGRVAEVALFPGVLDAWHGYPFWDPIALDEHRKYGR